MAGSASTVSFGLAALEARLAQDLAWLNFPPRAWLPERRSATDERVLDVAIIGAGLCGLVAAAALKQLGVERVRLFDRSPAGKEGPWVTWARMETLRTKKDVSGPALGIPSLTFRAWYEAQHGVHAWQQMEFAPRTQWMDYLAWYRRVLGLDVVNETDVVGIAPADDDLVLLDLRDRDRGHSVLARRVILATGIDGLGAPRLPEIASRLPKGRYAHSAEMIDMAALRGRRVAVVGAGASAMDNAAAALEAGAARVDLFVRRPDIPRVDKFTGIGSKGMTHGYVGLPDRLKWALMVEGERAQVPPPRHSTLRVSRHANAHFHLGSPIEDVAEGPGGVRVTTPRGDYETDFLIFSTGFSIDPARRPELASIRDAMLTWQDRLPLDLSAQNPGLAQSPYLSPDFGFIARDASQEAFLARIHCFAFPAVMSHGKITSGIPAASDGAQRLAQGIVRSLFVEHGEDVLAAFRAYDTPEILGDEWIDADLASSGGKSDHG